jgi:tryptophan synthase alpha chain
MNRPVMCHVVAGYPSPDVCVQLMLGMQQAGVTAVEVQVPFSDPIADGEAIMGANDVVLASGMTTEGSFQLIERARSMGFTTDAYVMSYLQKLQHFGYEAFCSLARDCGVLGLIIPDLPIDAPEYLVLAKLCKQYGLNIIPVLSPGMDVTRLHAWLASSPPMLYVTSRRGITGSAYWGTAELLALVAQIRSLCEATVLIGFGIVTTEDVSDALEIGDIAVIGSAIIKRVRDAGLDDTLAYIRDLIKEGATT